MIHFRTVLVSIIMSALVAASVLMVVEAQPGHLLSNQQPDSMSRHVKGNLKTVFEHLEQNCSGPDYDYSNCGLWAEQLHLMFESKEGGEPYKLDQLIDKYDNTFDKTIPEHQQLKGQIKKP
jgi:hypothetical protein